MSECPTLSVYSFLSSPVSPYKGPRNLQTSEPTRTSFRVTWDPAPGDVKGYRVTFHPVGDDIDLGELLVGPYDNTVVLEELRWVFRLISLSCGQLNFEEYLHVYHLKNLIFFFRSTELAPNTQWMCLVCLMEERVCHWLERRKPLLMMDLTLHLLRLQVKWNTIL